MDRLRDKVVIITGASDGLGRVMATMFSAEGAPLVLAARRTEQLEDTARLVRDAGGEAVTVTTDVSLPRTAVNDGHAVSCSARPRNGAAGRVTVTMRLLASWLSMPCTAAVSCGARGGGVH